MNLVDIVATLAVVLFGQRTTQTGVEEGHLLSALGGREDKEVQEEPQVQAQEEDAQLIGKKLEPQHQLSTQSAAPRGGHHVDGHWTRGERH